MEKTKSIGADAPDAVRADDNRPAALTFALALATPALVRGAEDRLELRVPTILGQLRQWWRALVHARTELHRPGSLRNGEFTLFGAAASDDSGRDGAKGGQGLFIPTLEITSASETPLTSNARALLGRPAHAGLVAEFELGLHFRWKAKPEHRLELAAAVDAWVALGGMGYGARRGLGSLARRTPSTSALWMEEVRRLTTTACRGARLDFPAFSSASWIRACRVEGDPFRKLQQILGKDPQHALSDQLALERRLPSPVHWHVARCSDATLLVASFIPTSTPCSEKLSDRLKALPEALPIVVVP